MSTAPIASPRPVEAAMALLNSGVPLSLLLDLALGPFSEELFVTELAALPEPRPPAG